MRVYFMRHGLAEENASGAMVDAERALVPEGEARARRTAQVLRQLGVQPTALYSSPLVRARQTAAIVGQELGVEVVVRPELDLRFNAAVLEKLIAEAGRVAEVRHDDCFFLVGHEPGMSAVIASLIGAADSAVEMKKGAVARVDLIQLQPPRGVLVWLLPPRVMAALE